MKELREYVATNPPELGGRQAKVDPNIANVPWIGNASWEQGYVDFHPADMLLKEFEYSPTRNDGSTIPMTIYQKNLLAQAAGVEIMETGIVVLDRPPYLGVYTTDEAIMNTVSLHWVTRTPNVVMLGGGGNAVTGANWSTNNLRGVYDTDLGPALGDPYVLTTGTDPHGYAYTVYARQFSCGLSIVRERGAWSQDIGGPSDGSANTEVTVTLPDSYIPIDTDGNAFPAVTQATLRNGQGKMFISSSVADPPCTPLWTCTGWSACPSGSQTRSCTDQNNCGTNNGRPAETQSCTPPPCTENWSCGAWSACSNSTQSRSCTDGSACGTTVSRPALNQSCDSTAPAAVTDFRAT